MPSLSNPLLGQLTSLSASLRIRPKAAWARSSRLPRKTWSPGPIGNALGPNSSLGKLGISPATAAKFVPQVARYVGKVGGEDVGALLGSALK